MFSEKSWGPAVDERHEAKYGVQHGDAEEVPKRAEMRHALLAFRVIDIDLDGHQIEATPSGENEQFQLSFIARCEQVERRQLS